MDIINSKVETALKKKTKHNKPQNTSRTCPVESKFLMKILRVYIFPSKNMNVWPFVNNSNTKKKRKDYFWPLRQSENTIWGCGVIVSFCESLDFAFAVVQLFQRAFWSRSSCVGKAETEEHGLHCPTCLPSRLTLNLQLLARSVPVVPWGVSSRTAGIGCISWLCWLKHLAVNWAGLELSDVSLATRTHCLLWRW